MDKQLTLIGTHTLYQPFNTTIDWCRPFNQVAFINTGSSGNIYINLLKVTPGNQHVVALNFGEVNLDTFTLSLDNNASGTIVFTMYDKVNITR